MFLEKMRRTLSEKNITNWDFNRALRAVIAITIGVMTFQAGSAFAGLLAAVVLFQALTVACYPQEACNIPRR